jgi:hypothetical protein
MSLKASPFTVISYDLMGRMAEALSERNFNMIIADEAHYLKNRDV